MVDLNTFYTHLGSDIMVQTNSETTPSSNNNSSTSTPQAIAVIRETDSQSVITRRSTGNGESRSGSIPKVASRQRNKPLGVPRNQDPWGDPMLIVYLQDKTLLQMFQPTRGRDIENVLRSIHTNMAT